jgi:outer membrane receptor protein involved in Fe transport
VFLPLVAFASALHAQEAPRTLGAVVVIAERAGTPMNRSTAAVTRLTASDLARLPHATVADVLRQVPGIAVVDFDGVGRDPQLMVRGFYGGGEADYVVVMVDGRPVNLVHNGTIAWEVLPPLSAIESIEIIRGSASAVHGDAAVGGVISIRTRRWSDRSAQWRVQAESFAGLSASLDLADVVAGRNAAASLSFDRTDGFRDHAARTSATARGKIRLTRTLDASLRGSWRDFEEPGPLLESLLGDGTESDPRFRSDRGHDSEWGATADYGGSLGAGGDTRTTFRVSGRKGTMVRTLPLATNFGDTRERKLQTFDAGVTTQADLNPTILPFGERLSVGASADFGSIDSRYYSGADGQRTLDADGSGHRLALGVFAHFVNSPRDWLRWTLGLHLDRLADSFSHGPTDSDAAHFGFSPKAGVNIRYAGSGRATGHAWASVSRTFKAPTLDQLFDQRPIPIPFPPFSVTTSNPDLNPQRGTSVEAGIYHDVAVGAAQLGATLTLYQIAMSDELDFDLQAFRYVNIAQSRHRGAEAGFTLSGGAASAFVSLTFQDAVSRAGPNRGKQLKAIPGQLLATGVTVSPPQLGTVSLSLTRTADMFIDDPNSRRIPSWTRADAQYSRPIGAFAIVVGARNLLDVRINGTGFLDPSGSGEAYFYPAAGRVLTLGVRYGR